MATPWLKEYETGRYYMNYTYPDGEIVRRYEDELQQEQGQSTYDPEPQEGSSEQYSVDQRGVDTRTSTSSSRRHTLETPRSESRHPVTSNRGTRRQSISFAQPTARPQLAPRHSSREGKEYHDSKGYNPSYKEGIDDQAGYNEADPDPRFLASSSYQEPSNTGQNEVTYEEASIDSATAEIQGLNIQDADVAPSVNYKFSPPQQTSGLSMYNATGTPSKWPLTPGPQMSAPYKVVGKGVARGGSQPRPHLIRGNPRTGESEPLDPAFKMRSRDYIDYFQCGRVFKTLWTDPAGFVDEIASVDDQFMSSHRYKVAHRQYVYSKIRRFVVVLANDRSCQCLPVTTYNGRGLTKSKIDIGAHGLICNLGDSIPTLNIRGIKKEPLIMKPSPDGETLSRDSYINYGRAYCVETNVKVKDLGVLNRASRSLLRRYYMEYHMPSDDEFSGPDYSRTPKMQTAEVAHMGTGLEAPGGYYVPLTSKPEVSMSGYSQPETSTTSGHSRSGKHRQSTYTSSRGRRPSLSQREGSQYQVEYQTGANTQVEHSVGTEYSGIASDQAAGDEQHWPAEDQGHAAAQSAPFATVDTGADEASYEEEPPEQPHAVYESATAAGPSGSISYYSSVEQSQSQPESGAADEGDEEGNDPLADVQSRQPPRESASSGRRRRHHRHRDRRS